MGLFKSFLTRFTIELFLLLFVYPAIGFALLVLGFTSSWKSGTLMLVSALLLRFALKREAAASRPGFRASRSRGTRRSASRSAKQPNGFGGFYDQGSAPPQLSDIYQDMATQMREQEALLKIIREQEARKEDRCK
ncbi:hypothetical protein GXP70_06365 [Paenibacillus lycopersici]|uniref:Uncharacterized protein n=1 Tax=Paenibacillus lycopersici TaxID=2704462 RepID=A0A6C0FUC5_9BACL|nr:hypothetical protein [Paenibacillus lycopersici]QHT59612.1 hypothetical protein GXP70_06365 [Paenibacillus lycopersici]